MQTPTHQHHDYPEYVPYTPNVHQSHIFRYYCAICMMHFRKAYTARCCTQVICEPCARALYEKCNAPSQHQHPHSSHPPHASTSRHSRKYAKRPDCPYCTQPLHLRVSHASDVDTPRGNSSFSSSPNPRPFHTTESDSALVSKHKSLPPNSPFRAGMSFEEMRRKMLAAQHEGYGQEAPKDGEPCGEQFVLERDQQQMDDFEMEQQRRDEGTAEVEEDVFHTYAVAARRVRSAPSRDFLHLSIGLAASPSASSACTSIDSTVALNRPLSAAAKLPPRPHRRRSQIVPVSEDNPPQPAEALSEQEEDVDIVPLPVCHIDAADEREVPQLQAPPPPRSSRRKEPVPPPAPVQKKGCCSIL